MFKTALITALIAVAAIALLSACLSHRMRRRERREAEAVRARSLTDFLRSGRTADQVLSCGTAGRQILLLADTRSGILRIDNCGAGRLDIRFRDLMDCRLLIDGAAAAQAGEVPPGDPASGSPEQVHSMRLVLTLCDTLVPTVEIDLLPVPVSRSSPDYRRAAVFSREALALMRRILAGNQSPASSRTPSEAPAAECKNNT